MSDALSVALAACGFASVGDPPAVTLDVLGHAVHVTVSHDPAIPESPDALSGRVRLTAQVAIRRLEPGLERAALGAAGDTVYVAEGTDLVARRTLVAPDPTLLHDAVHELAKAALVLSGAEVDRPAPPPPPAAPTPPPPPAPAPPPPAAAAPPPPAAGSYWCFVDAATPLRAGPTDADVVAMLVPGTWYAATGDDGTWVRIHHPSGAEGVALRTEVTPA